MHAFPKFFRTLSASLSVMDGYWHQFTVRWESSEGDWAIYKDAILQGEGKEPLFSNGTIPPGTLHIGSRPYSSDVTFAFIGRITSLNVWNYYLSDAEVASIDRNCGQGLGNLFQWIDLKEKVDGQVKVLEPSSCKYEVT